MPDRATKELTSSQRRAIAHMLIERDVPSAAKASGFGERTLWRWLAQDHFRAALAEAETHTIDYAVRRLINLADSAIETLKTVLDSETATSSVKVRAALGILDHLAQLRELRNVEIRLTALEQLYYADKKPNEY